MTAAPFLTVDFGTPIDIGLLPASLEADTPAQLTVAWQPKLGTTYLPYEEEPDE